MPIIEPEKPAQQVHDEQQAIQREKAESSRMVKALEAKLAAIKADPRHHWRPEAAD